ncbi:MAG: alpha/beta hydrolase [Scytolyngbya sp. HA4215-MV1]|jgi:pimeloyl-ACP methyl ester carboxylesterase|nr:alpha/beta hydrolase [Scytolyngbya sp. HA4215-MV1]
MNKLIRRNSIYLLLIAALSLGVILITSLGVIMNPVSAQSNKPTVVLVHGAFAESDSWNGVLTKLIAKGYPTVAAANPLRGVKSDASYVASILKSIEGPIVLVGHSYGGSVITNAVNGNQNVKALVYVAGFAPDTGESAAALSTRYPGSTLGPTLATPVALPDGGKDLYIQQSKFHAQFAADVPIADAKLMASTQRPVTDAALNEASGAPAWKSTPSWFIYGEHDLNIPAAVHAFMAKRANSKKTIAVQGASHVVMISHADAVAKLIEHAATTK